MVSESRVTWTTSVTILVFLGLSVLNLGPIYMTDRCQTASSLGIVRTEKGKIQLVVLQYIYQLQIIGNGKESVWEEELPETDLAHQRQLENITRHNPEKFWKLIS